jgi:hypothetical protein
MITKLSRISPLAALLLLGACTTIPTGPSVMAMPGTGKSFDQFRADDADCRQYALGQVGGATANDASVDSAAKSAAVGTAVGALAGAALGGRQGAGVGAGVGLLAGGLSGAGAGQASGYGTQRRYDNAYVQCMYSKGERVPVSGRMTSAAEQTVNSPPPANTYAPPPPPPGPQAATPAGPTAQPAAGTWYYCDSAKAYYPYVTECRDGWRSVPANPPQTR